MKIETATLEHLGDITKLHNDVLNIPYSYQQYLSEMNLKYSLLRVLKVKGYIIGFALFHIIFDEAEIISIGLNKRIQNKGYGQLLINDIFRIMKLNDCHNIFLEVEVNNQQALRFYQKNGFQYLSTRKDYYGKDNHAYILRKESEQ